MDPNKKKKDVSDLVVQLTPLSDAPLYQWVSQWYNKNPVKRGDITHQWIEDDLVPYIRTMYVEDAEPVLKVCPKFVICPYPACRFYKPEKSAIYAVQCSWAEPDGSITTLVEVDEKT